MLSIFQAAAIAREWHEKQDGYARGYELGHAEGYRDSAPDSRYYNSGRWAASSFADGYRAGYYAAVSGRADSAAG